MSRTRSRYREVVRPVLGTVTVLQPGGSVYSSYSSTYHDYSHFELIEDVVGSRNKVHPVTHNTIQLASLPIPTRSIGGWTEVNTNRYVFDIPAGTIETLFLGASHLDMGEFSDNAYDALVPQVPQEVSLPNFLYELREISALLPTLQDGIVKSLSGGYLNYQFGWKPFIGDVQKLMSLMSIVRARLEYLQSTWGKETRISYQTSFQVDARDNYPLNGLYWTTAPRGIARCGGYLYHELQDLDGLIGEYRALSGALGFNNPLAVIWEAIPFSFVADWFTRVGSLISRTPIQPFVGVWDLRRLTHSWEIGGSFTGIARWDPGYTPSEYQAHSGKATFYRRDVGLPVSASILYRDGLNPQQQALGAALLAGFGR